jgi:CHAD domain-containing protein
LRSCLSLIGRIAGTEPVSSLVGEVRWLAGILGTARDWDVLATDTMPPLTVAFAHDPVTARELRRLTRSIGAHRSAARKAAREAVRSQRFQRLLLTIGAYCARPGVGGTVRVRDSAREFASELLSDRDGKLRQCATSLEHGTAEERHAVRIAAKKLRYVAEFFSPPQPGRRNRHYLRALSRLQDALGRWQDTVTAARLMAGLTANSDRVVVGAVRGWSAAQAVTIEREIAGAWRQFDATLPFWTRR